MVCAGSGKRKRAIRTIRRRWRLKRGCRRPTTRSTICYHPRKNLINNEKDNYLLSFSFKRKKIGATVVPLALARASDTAMGMAVVSSEVVVVTVSNAVRYWSERREKRKNVKTKKIEMTK